MEELGLISERQCIIKKVEKINSSLFIKTLKIPKNMIRTKVKHTNLQIVYFFLAVTLTCNLESAVETPSSHKCQAAISALATDLKGLQLTKKKTEQIFTILFDARKLCSLGNQEPALKEINRARALAGLEATTGEFDWENIPLESLEVED